MSRRRCATTVVVIAEVEAAWQAVVYGTTKLMGFTRSASGWSEPPEYRSLRTPAETTFTAKRQALVSLFAAGRVVARSQIPVGVAYYLQE